MTFSKEPLNALLVLAPALYLAVSLVCLLFILWVIHHKNKTEMWSWVIQSLLFLFWFKSCTYLLKTNLKEGMRPCLGARSGVESRKGQSQAFPVLKGESRLSPGPPPTLELSSQSHCQFKDKSDANPVCLSCLRNSLTPGSGDDLEVYKNWAPSVLYCVE